MVKYEHFKMYNKNAIMMCLSPMFSTLERDTDVTLMNSTNWACVLRRNTAAGSTSGLQIFFKQFNNSERLINASKITGHSAVRVRVKIIVVLYDY